MTLNKDFEKLSRRFLLAPVKLLLVPLQSFSITAEFFCFREIAF